MEQIHQLLMSNVEMPVLSPMRNDQLAREMDWHPQQHLPLPLHLPEEPQNLLLWTESK
jgi:hypothetical protein